MSATRSATSSASKSRSVTDPVPGRPLGDADDAVGEQQPLVLGQALDTDQLGDGVGDGSARPGPPPRRTPRPAGCRLRTSAVRVGVVGDEAEVGPQAVLDLLAGRSAAPVAGWISAISRSLTELSSSR